MKAKYFITGTSAGLGEALAKLFANDAHVEGYARRDQSINGNYQHHVIDLSDLDQVNQIQFTGEESHWVLINNAGTIGPIKKAGFQSKNDIANVFDLNVSSLCLIMDRFIESVKKNNKQATIINVSSGAGSYPIPGWAAYCASKAAVDMYSETVQQELNEDQYPIRVLSLAPGVVDTPMQGQIREASSQHFSRVNEFIAKKKEGELSDPQTVALKIEYILNHPQEFSGVKCSVRDVIWPNN